MNGLREDVCWAVRKVNIRNLDDALLAATIYARASLALDRPSPMNFHKVRTVNQQNEASCQWFYVYCKK